jgi:hypothetical protein
MFFDQLTTLTKLYFSYKNSTFCDLKKSDQDSDPHWFGSLDPDPCRDKSWIRGSTTLDLG